MARRAIVPRYDSIQSTGTAGANQIIIPSVQKV